MVERKCEGRTLCLPSVKVIEDVCKHSEFMPVYINSALNGISSI